MWLTLAQGLLAVVLYGLGILMLGVALLPGAVIVDGATVAAGAVVPKDHVIPAGATYLGPSR
jgi:hypothetical protein